MGRDGGPAFPFSREWQDRKGYTEREDSDGMSLRDWFAGQALSGFLAAGAGKYTGELAEDAYDMADAMLAAREEA